ncbi:hypothetical protein GLW05_20990 [Pontibacillus yanchengensis]|uniref:Holin n=1 Tax=Pontibacillus yanchengensis TaxID=462910 RepID=A0A6I5A6M8_9BACI|nr:phage holin family protein [Pontibacillus yanchengensis]MYL36051.1 hypothetical protein [Pontibacillus yanchengensis]
MAEEINLLSQLGLEGQHIVFIVVVALFTKLSVDALKKSIRLVNNYIPLISIVVGIGLSVLFSLLPVLEISLVVAAVYGVIAGLVAPGVHELIKKRFGDSKDNKEERDVA